MSISKKVEKPKTGIDRYSDLNNGRRLAKKFGNDLAFVMDVRQWVHWNSKRFEYNPMAVMDCAKVVSSDIWNEVGLIDKDNKNKSHFLRSALYAQSAKGLFNMVKMAESELAIRASELDTDPRLLNTPGGVLDLNDFRNFKLLKHSIEHRMTKLTNVPFDPKAKCRIFPKFFSRITDNNRELQRALQMVLGSTLEGASYEEALFILKGGGSNGKTTLVNVLLSIHGSYGKQLTPNFMMVKKIQDHPTEVADLFKVRFAVSLEPDGGCQLSESFVKWITGRDMLKARRMRQDFWEFQPTHKLFLCVNERPQITGTTYGTWRRIKEFPFDVTITEEEKDVMLEGKLIVELPGIFNWILEGYRLWRENGCRYYIPRIVEESTRGYMDSQDTIQPFITDMCRLGPKDDDAFLEMTKTVYAAYDDWCEDNHIKPLEFQRFKNAMEGKGIREQKWTKDPYKGRLVLSGIRLKTYADQTEELKQQEAKEEKQPEYSFH
jgi:putative DNA primase/helicase